MTFQFRRTLLNGNCITLKLSLLYHLRARAKTFVVRCDVSDINSLSGGSVLNILPGPDECGCKEEGNGRHRRWPAHPSAVYNRFFIPLIKIRLLLETKTPPTYKKSKILNRSHFQSHRLRHFSCFNVNLFFSVLNYFAWFFLQQSRVTFSCYLYVTFSITS